MYEQIFPQEIPQVGQKIRIAWRDGTMYIESIVMSRYAVEYCDETTFHVYFFSHEEYPYLMYLDKEWILYRGDEAEYNENGDKIEDLIVDVFIIN